MTKDDLNILIWPAMLYALKPKGYLSNLICNVIIRNAKDIRKDIRLAMAEEINLVLELEPVIIKDQMHIEKWQKVLETLNNKE